MSPPGRSEQARGTSRASRLEVAREMLRLSLSARPRLRLRVFPTGVISGEPSRDDTCCF